MTPYYEQDGVTIYCGDCRDVLPSILAGGELAFITDPPYGINYSTGRGRGAVKGYASWAHTTIQNDGDTSCRDWLIEFVAGRYPLAVFGTWKVPKPAGVRGTLIWDKGPAFGMGDLSFPWKPSFEEIYILNDGWKGRRDEAVLRGHIVVSWESEGRTHPNEKPVSLCCHLISKTKARTKIVDPFMGTGATLVAAKKCGRRAIGIELEEHYCETAARRLAQGVLPLRVEAAR
jgi:DNA modification methylase